MSAAAREFWSRLAAALDDGREVLLAVVAESSVHSPGTPGARLFVARGGESYGTIGGGVMELRLMERAQQILDEAGLSDAGGTAGGWAERAEMLHRKEIESELADRAVQRSGMICAGRQTNLYGLLRPPADGAAVEGILRRLEEGGDGTWSLDSDGRFAVDDEALDAARRLESGESGAWLYRESLVERRRVAVLGGGHCGRALARLMAGLGWHVSVWETRPAMIEEMEDDAELRRVAEIRRVDDFRRAGPRIDHPELTPVVVMTTDVPNDVRALYGVLSDESGGERRFPFVGAMGSAAKLEEIRRRLRGLGLSDDALDKITAPVGLQIGSDTPPEIAVSVAAQLLELRHEWLDE